MNTIKNSYLLTLLLTLLSLTSSMAQNINQRSLAELINKKEPGWALVTQWMREGKNKVEVLPKDPKQADAALYQAQVTTRSPMGAIIYETGGILVDGGWLRILGSGSPKLNRSVMEWNKGKSYDQFGEQPSFLLVADDAMGGFFAINAGGIAADEIGIIFYFAPDVLQWESMGVNYSEFLTFCFSGDLSQFYKGLRWDGWEKDVQGLTGDQAILSVPFLWTSAGKDLNKTQKKPVPIQELWSLYYDQNK